jgi:hypothetical protein
MLGGKHAASQRGQGYRGHVGKMLHSSGLANRQLESDGCSEKEDCFPVGFPLEPC